MGAAALLLAAAAATHAGQPGYGGWSHQVNGWHHTMQPHGGYGYGGYGYHGGACGPHGCGHGCMNPYGGNFGCCGIYGSGVPVMGPPAYQAGPPVGAVTYPYYTIRGPRDFLMNNPPPLGP